MGLNNRCTQRPHCSENPTYVSQKKNCAFVPISCICERFIDSQDQATYFPAAKYADQLWEYINRLTQGECKNWTAAA